jgi:hypothetical protein
MVVAGEGGGEPDWHLFQGYVGVRVVSGGEGVCSVAGESLSLCPFHVGGPGPMHEPDILWFDLGTIIVGDVEPGGLPVVLFEAFWADGDRGVSAATAAVAAAVASSRGLVLFVVLDLFESIFCPGGASLRVVCFVQCVAEASVKESKGGGKILGVVQEDLAVAGSGDLEDHGSGAWG